MTFATCKYDRELRFIWSRLNYLRNALNSDNLPEAERKKLEIEFEELTARNKEISQTYIDNDMSEYLDDLMAKSSAPPLDFDDFDAVPCELVSNKTSNGTDPMSEIVSINKELSELDDALVKAQLNDNESEIRKIEMSVSSLKSRRSDLIERMKSADEEEEEEESDTAAYDKDIEELKRDIASLRTQLGMLRNDVMDLKSVMSGISGFMGRE